jgi:energy-coupling factor transporter ATP-binding protein EcfA2
MTATATPYDQMIRYPRFKALRQDISDCQQLSKLAGEAQCMSLEGPTGAGKTTLIRDYAALFPTEDRPDGVHMPVFYMPMPSPATTKGTASKMLSYLGDPAAQRGTQWSLDYRLANLIPACGVELVILDDFHNLIETETDRVLEKVSDWLKALIKETGVPFLVIGIEGKVERILQANRELSRLFAVRETLYPFTWDWSNPEANAEFVQFMTVTEQLVGLPLTTDVSRDEILWRLHYATDGIVANLMNLIRSSVLLAHKASESHISLAALEHAFSKRLAKHMRGKVNPFTPEHGHEFVPPPPPPANEVQPEETKGRRGKRTPKASDVLTTNQ